MGEITGEMKGEMKRQQLWNEDNVYHSAELEDRVRSADHKKASEIRRDLERTRVDLDNTMRRLRTRLEWSELASEAFETTKDYVIRKEPDFKGMAKRNVGPLALMAASLGWMIYRGTHDGYSNGMSSDGSGTMDTMKEKGSQLKEKGSQMLSSLKQKATDAMHSLRDKSSGAMDSMKEKTSESMDSLSESVGSLKDSASEKIGSMKDRATDKVSSMKDLTVQKISDTSEAAKEKLVETGHAAKEKLHDISDKVATGTRRGAVYARDQFSEKLQTNPLTVGAVVLAVGAACGLAVPLTHQEERMFGSTGDQPDVPNMPGSQGMTHDAGQDLGAGSNYQEGDELL